MNSGYTWITRCLCLLAIPFSTHSQSPAEIDSLVISRMKEKNIPGLSCAIIKDGKVIHKAAYGFADLAVRRPASSGSVFEIASMTKQFTCAAILLLEVEKKLSLSDRLARYIPDLPREWNDITLYQLMNHTSGLEDDWNKPTSYFYDHYTTEKMRLAQQRQTLRFPPGEGFHYSSGPFFLGLVIEKITGKPYAAFLQERIFSPLQMHRTYVYNDSTLIPERAAGYWWKNGKHQPGVDLPPAAEGRADVGILSCIDDMIIWCRAIKNGDLLDKQSTNKLFSYGILNNGKPVPYSMGWYIYPFRNTILYEHGGAFRTGFNSRILLFPEHNVEIVILCNLWQAGLADLSYDLASRVVPGFRTILPEAGIQDDAPHLTHRFEELFKKLADPELNHTILYTQVNAAGYESDEMTALLKGFKSLSLIQKKHLQSPMRVYGQDITEIRYYKTDALESQIWAFYLAKNSELVVVNIE